MEVPGSELGNTKSRVQGENDHFSLAHTQGVALRNHSENVQWLDALSLELRRKIQKQWRVGIACNTVLELEINAISQDLRQNADV